MKTYIVSFIFITLSYVGFSQPNIEWEKSFGGSDLDRVLSIDPTTDGGYIVGGTSWSIDGDVTGNNGLSDYWVVKLTANGSLDWQKSLGGSHSELAWSIQQTLDGGYIVSGGSRSNNGDVSGNHGDQDQWIVKLTETGSIEWQKSFGGTLSDFANSIQQTTDGGYIIAGYSRSNDGDVTGNHGSLDYWIVKINESGTLEWQKSLGGSDFDTAESIKQTLDGGYIVAGYSNSNDGDVSGNHGGSQDYWVVKLSIIGNIEWQKSLGGTGLDRALSVIQTQDNGYLVGGYSNSNDGDVTENQGSSDLWIVKLTETGSLDWQKSLGGSYGDAALSVSESIDGGFIVAGISESTDGDVIGNHGENDFWVLRFSLTGTLEWQKSIGGSLEDTALSIHQTLDGGYIVAGFSFSEDGDVTNNQGGADCWVVKLISELSVDDNEFKNKISLYPNPTNTKVTIKAEDLKEITIYNSLGKKVYLKELSGESIANIDVSHLAKGVYTVVVLASNQQMVKKLLIK